MDLRLAHDSAMLHRVAELRGIDEGTEVGRVVVEAGAGRSVPPDVPGPLVDSLRELLASPELRTEMGASGRSWVEQWVTPQRAAEDYEAVFEELT